MANSDSSPHSLPIIAPLSSEKENLTPIGSKIAVELNQSRSELLGRIQGLKQDLQSWRSKLDTQVKDYSEELSDLKKSLNAEVEQLRYEFHGLRTSLQQQQEDVTASLRNLGLEEATLDEKIANHSEPKNSEEELHVSTDGDDGKPALADDKAKETEK